MEVPQVTWEDIGGLEDVKRELQELVQVRAIPGLNRLIKNSREIPRQAANGDIYLSKCF